MGINLKKLVTTSEIDLQSLKSKRLTFDANSILHGFLSIIRDSKGMVIRDKNDNVTSHLIPLFYRNIIFLQNNLKPIYVFDGKPPKLKKELIQKRENKRKYAKKKYNSALKKKNYQLSRKYFQQMISLSDSMIDDAKKLLNLMGIPSIQAPSEAEATAAYLNKNSNVFAAVAQDYDSILFGATRIIRNLTVTGKRKIPGSSKYKTIKPELIDSKKTLRNLGISRKQLIDIAILIGTDYNIGGIEGFGPKTALNNIKKYKKLEKIPGIQDKLDKRYKKIRNLFLHPQVSKNPTIQFKKPSLSKLQDFLVEQRNFDQKKVENALSSLSDI